MRADFRLHRGNYDGSRSPDDTATGIATNCRFLSNAAGVADILCSMRRESCLLVAHLDAELAVQYGLMVFHGNLLEKPEKESAMVVKKNRMMVS